jgi:diadenosine tetraphosphate (Ap4A) HIT family hydrolase
MLLMNDANYPWIILVPRRAGAVEIVDLDAADRAALMDEIALASRALRDAVSCDKLNVAALGNVVPQLHVHVIARRKDDAAWPKPVWGVVPSLAYDEAEAERLVTALREGLRDR